MGETPYPPEMIGVCGTPEMEELEVGDDEHLRIPPPPDDVEKDEDDGGLAERCR